MSRASPVDVRLHCSLSIRERKASLISSHGWFKALIDAPFQSYLHQSSSLAHECRSRGVYIQSLCPGYVVSKLSGIRKATLMAPTPEQFVLSALDRVALPFTTGYWTHELQVRQSQRRTSAREANCICFL